MTELLKALSNVKKEVGKLSKTETNPFFKSKYFDINSLIEQVEPLLEKNNLLLLQPIENNKVRSIIYHIETSQSVTSEIDLPNLQDPQKLGSAITYYRRYTLQSLLGLQAEDDDANKVSQVTKTPTLDLERLNTRLNACTNLTELQTAYKSFSVAEQKATVATKDKLKLTLK